ncbi:disulfide bond formation protein B [Methyloceanibacter superfactus]|uniref:Disulfide bond formation protein B n=1 Tax=Methyloceanibacter superfactus TaxID=1774969 RepID=A0A1E3VSB5_9HYPH|nr:disulfide bond formation protein B [Methyloceanibacter superfactus]ODR96424.1 disulfide bond formation protein B [Methyloceanibacter superfactus]
MTADLSRLLNALALIALDTVLVLAFVDQLWFRDLPCPLCILQRAGFFAAGFGIALNLFFGPKPSHYGIAILGAIAGGIISMRQILLHIVPGTGSYGNAIFGMHLYTWAFIAFALMIVGCAVMLLDDRQFSRAEPISMRLKVLPLTALLMFLVLAVTNVASTVALCGAGFCPDSPKDYMLFETATN